MPAAQNVTIRKKIRSHMYNVSSLVGLAVVKGVFVELEGPEVLVKLSTRPNSNPLVHGEMLDLFGLGIV
eukprot:7821348-Heterocapsa_arctica.AAC.1